MHLNSTTLFLLFHCLAHTASSIPTPVQQHLPRRAIQKRAKSYAIVAVDGGSSGSPAQEISNPPPAATTVTVVSTKVESTAFHSTKTIVSIVNASPAAITAATVVSVHPVATVQSTTTPVSKDLPKLEPPSPERYENTDEDEDEDEDEGTDVHQIKVPSPTRSNVAASGLLNTTTIKPTSPVPTVSSTTWQSTSSSSYDDGLWHPKYPNWNSTGGSYAPSSPTGFASLPGPAAA
ncbi:MAG: hypothetical protein M1825_005352 [Sarcosagium campestre]|nr:MAG: hypothetical protein M1825_005352 [Sarcosagium campestre]